MNIVNNHNASIQKMINSIQNIDCLQGFPSIIDGSIDLVFADPPFNIGYQYDKYQDRKNPEQYLQWCSQWINECSRVLKDTGSMFLAIGDEYVANLKLLLDATRMTMRNWIIWHYTFGTACQTKFSRCHAHILYYVKNPKCFTWNGDAIRVPSSRQTTYKDKRANAKGKIPDDVWSFPRVCGTFKERTEHPCQMPLSVLDRIIKVASNPGDIVLDPFSGSGTTLVAAQNLGRSFMGFELSESYCKIIEERLSQCQLSP